MMMKKRLIALGMTGLMAVSMMACGSSQTADTAKDTDSTTSDDAIEVVIWDSN